MDLVSPESAGFSSDRLSRVDAHLAQYVEQGKLAGIIAAIARRGRLVYCKTFGQADLEAGKPMSLDTILRIYSMTKPITSVALMMLYEQARFTLPDPVSRFIPGWTMVAAEAADPVIACFEQAVQRYGRPEGVMSDRGSAFHAWRGLSRFEALLEEYEVNYYLAKEAAVNGKVEALNASFQKECVEPYEFLDLSDAARQIGRWVEHYNHQRTHHGLGGLLVPADRFYGIAEQSLRRIEQGLGATTAELSSPDSRALELFRVLSRGGKPEIWLMGEKILG